MKKVISKYNIFPSHRLGQNFLVNKGIVEKIIIAADLSKNDIVLEIGPGMGALTEELAKRAGHVIAVEKDPRLYELLKEKFENVNNLMLVNADILHFNFQFPISNFQEKFKIQNSKFKIVANIPYNITGAFFQKFLLAENRPLLIIVMVQKEVGERLLGKKDRSLLTLAAELYGTAEKICDVSAGSFNPPPKVTSMVVRLIAQPYLSSPTREAEYSGIQINNLEQKIMHLAKIGFANRRKKLISNLSTGLKKDKKYISSIFAGIKLKEGVRAEELSKYDWLKLAELL